MQRQYSTLNELLAKLPEEERNAVESQALQIITEVDGLRELRRLTQKTQVAIAESLGIQQPAISQIERQSDMYLSTLRRFVQAAGGELDLIVRFPDRRPLRLSGFADLEDYDDPPSQEQDAA